MIEELSREFRVSSTIYKVNDRVRKQEFTPLSYTNRRFLAAKFGMEHLSKVEALIQRKEKAEARRYNKNHPSKMLHTKHIYDSRQDCRIVGL